MHRPSSTPGPSESSPAPDISGIQYALAAHQDVHRRKMTECITALQHVASTFNRCCESVATEEVLALMRLQWESLLQKIERKSGNEIANLGLKNANATECLHQHINGETGELTGQVAMEKTLQADALGGKWETLQGYKGLVFPMHKGFWRFKNTYNVEFFENEHELYVHKKTIGEADFACTYTADSLNTDQILLVDFCLPQSLIRKRIIDYLNLARILEMCSGIDSPAQKLHIVLTDTATSSEHCEPLDYRYKPIPGSFIMRAPLIDTVHNIASALKKVYKGPRTSFRDFENSLAKIERNGARK